MKYFIVAGEKSGDQHAGKLIEAIRNSDERAHFKGVGGDSARLAGMELLFHYQEIAVMGFWEVFLRFLTLKKRLNQCKREIAHYSPNLVILIDSGGFNLPLAQFAKKQGYAVLYFIPPKIWAWGSWRAAKLRKYTDHVVVSLPFEVDLFNKLGVKTVYLGSPVANSIYHHGISDKNTSRDHIALLPGSRRQEIKYHLPLMINVAKHTPKEQFVIYAIKELSDFYVGEDVLPENATISFHTTQNLRNSKAAVVASGTATLEACIYNVPQVVIYKTNPLNYLMARILMRIKYISLVNLMMGDQIVKELIQSRANHKDVTDELIALISDKSYRNRIISNYEKIRARLGDRKAYQETADLVKEMIG